jgi:hypothetical protein
MPDASLPVPDKCTWAGSAAVRTHLGSEALVLLVSAFADWVYLAGDAVAVPLPLAHSFRNPICQEQRDRVQFFAAAELDADWVSEQPPGAGHVCSLQSSNAPQTALPDAMVQARTPFFVRVSRGVRRGGANGKLRVQFTVSGETNSLPNLNEWESLLLFRVGIRDKCRSQTHCRTVRSLGASDHELDIELGALPPSVEPLETLRVEFDMSCVVVRKSPLPALPGSPRMFSFFMNSSGAGAGVGNVLVTLSKPAENAPDAPAGETGACVAGLGQAHPGRVLEIFHELPAAEHYRPLPFQYRLLPMRVPSPGATCRSRLLVEGRLQFTAPSWDGGVCGYLVRLRVNGLASAAIHSIAWRTGGCTVVAHLRLLHRQWVRVADVREIGLDLHATAFNNAPSPDSISFHPDRGDGLSNLSVTLVDM